MDTGKIKSNKVHRSLLFSSFLLATALAAIAVLFLPLVSSASPQATPPFVTTSLAPNVLISIDTSGSMRWGHSGLSYPDDAVYVISKSIYNTNYGSYWGNDVKAEVIQIAEDIGDQADLWLENLPGLTGYYHHYRYNPSVFVDLTSHVSAIKTALSSSDHTVMTMGGVRWIVFKGSWGATNYKFHGPYNYGYLSRITMAKWVITKLIRNTTGIQYGIMRFDNGCNQHTGGRIVFPCTDLTADYDGNGHPDREDLINYVNSIYADGCTPLANTLYEACRYFGGGTSPSGAYYYGAFASKIMNSSGHYISPIQYWCQKSFVILTTDGESYKDGGNVPSNIQDYDHDHNSHDGSHSSSDSLDDVALYAYDTDFRPSLGNGEGETTKQNFSTYTIGFGGAAATLLQEAADDDHGHGEYYGSTGQGSLYASLQEAINDILYRISSGTAVAVLSTSKFARDKFFRAKFHPRGWKGFLECFRLPYTGQSPIWEAGEKLHTRDPSDRLIYTVKPTMANPNHRVQFLRGNITKTMLGVSTNSEKNHLVNFIRGSYDESWGYRDRDPNGNGGDQWKLGDIIYSTPAVRSEPEEGWDAMPDSPALDSYSEFRTHRYGRPPVVIVGANDGMLHAFYINGTNKGKEKWAFIPHNLLYNLKSLADDPYSHNYYVDLTPVIADCQIGSSVTDDHGWKTILLSGERQGGKAYFALDVTGSGTGYPKPLWEFMDANLGESWSIPSVGVVSTSSGYKWIGIFGSGYDNADSRGHLYGVNMADGSTIFNKIVDSATNNVMASPVAIDFDDDSLTDRVYIGDILGRLWRVTPNSNEVWDAATYPRASILTSTGFTVSGHYNSQPIRIKPSLSFYERTNGRVIAVYFGTGKFDLVEDKNNTDAQSFYCILDEDTASFPLGRSDLVDSDHPGIRGYCSENGAVPAGKHGWYFDLPHSGERVTASSLLAGGIVFFTTFTPNNDICGYGGVARLYAVKYDTGCAPDSPVLDLNGDNVVDASDTSTGQPGGEIPKSVIIGNGLPSAPVFDSKHNQIIVQTSDTTVHVRTVNLSLKSFKVHYWKEIFQ